MKRAVAKVSSLAVKAGCLGDRRTDFEIVLHEVLANAVLHGNGGDPARTIRVRCYGMRGRGLMVAVRDQGRGFDPSTVPDPTHADRLQLHHGRGLFLVRELTDHVEHRKSGREIVFCKVCEGGKKKRRAPLG